MSGDLLTFVLVSLVTVVYCGNYTVTDEAWFEVKIKDLDGPGFDYRGRFVVALFGETAPITVLNFKSLVKGYQRGKVKLHYKDTPVHRVVPDFIIQMGDVIFKNGTGGTSIYGGLFSDEDFVLSHRSAGWVAMANHGSDTNGSQFYILLNRARWLDGHHVVFGKVIRGFDVLRTIEEVDTDRRTSRPKNQIQIVDCGMEDLDRKYDLSEDQLDSTEDL